VRAGDHGCGHGSMHQLESCRIVQHIMVQERDKKALRLSAAHMLPACPWPAPLSLGSAPIARSLAPPSSRSRARSPAHPLFVVWAMGTGKQMAKLIKEKEAKERAAAEAQMLADQQVASPSRRLSPMRFCSSLSSLYFLCSCPPPPQTTPPPQTRRVQSGDAWMRHRARGH